MTYYKPCPECGANLDPGKRCGCMDFPPETKRNYLAIVGAMTRGLGRKPSHEEVIAALEQLQKEKPLTSSPTKALT